jgi:O-antigen/teichoic acid export membrane protein
MSRLSRNILWNLAGQAVLLGLGVLAVRFVFRQLGADAFGLILFAQTAGYVLIGVFDLGIAATNVREVAAHFSTDRAYVVDLLRTGALMYWARRTSSPTGSTCRASTPVARRGWSRSSGPGCC